MITSVDNARVKAARALHRPKERRKTGLCILEGLRLVETGFRAGAAINEAFVTPSFTDESRASSLVEQLRSGGVPVTHVKEHVLSRMALTETPQGIVAVARQRTTPMEEFAGLPGLLIADRIADPGNMGTMVRTAAAVGVGVWTGEASTDLYDPKTLRASVGTLFHVPHMQKQPYEQMMAGVDDLRLRLVVADAAGTVRYDEFDWREPFALVIGNEAQGVDARYIERAHTIVRLPLHAGVESLNAAVTASVCLFEAWRRRDFTSA